MRNEETSVVTAYFDINRGRSGIKGMQRGNSKYLEYFNFWARMENQLIVYTTRDFEKEIMAVRESFGQEEQTEIVIIDNAYMLEPDVYNKMDVIEKNGQFSGVRLHTKAMSNCAKYDYIMFLKYWCLKDAAERFSLNGNIAWIDFGFNHGGERYINAKEFAFYWTPTIPENKVVLYTRKPIEQVDLLTQLLLQTNCVMGCPVILNAKLATAFYTLIKKACESLLMLNVIDDDQQLLTMAYNWKPDFFEVHMSDWFLPLKENGGEHLSVKLNDTKSLTPIKRILIQVASDVKHAVENDHSRPIIKDYVWRLKKFFGEYLNK